LRLDQGLDVDAGMLCNAIGEMSSLRSLINTHLLAFTLAEDDFVELDA
jgi:hypothetical protein